MPVAPCGRACGGVLASTRRGSRYRALESGPLRISLSSHLLTVSRAIQGIEESRGLFFALCYLTEWSLSRFLSIENNTSPVFRHAPCSKRKTVISDNTHTQYTDTHAHRTPGASHNRYSDTAALTQRTRARGADMAEPWTELGSWRGRAGAAFVLTRARDTASDGRRIQSPRRQTTNCDTRDRVTTEFHTCQ